LTTGAGTVTNDTTGLALLGLQLSGSGFLLTGNALTLDSGGWIKALSGDHEVAFPLTLSGPASLTAASNQTLTASGAISGDGAVMVSGGRVILGNAANAFTGPTVLQTGLLEVASIRALGAGTAPVVLGRGTFRYAGTAPGDLAQGYTVSNGGGNASTVLDIRTNLTVSGKVDAPSAGSGRVVKIGSGTIAYTYPGYQVMNRGGSGVTTDRNLVIDTLNGGAGVEGYHDFTIADGRVVFNTPGQTNRFISGVTIGERYSAAAYMDIGAGVVQAPDSWLSISRGNGDATTPYASGVTMTGGRLELWGLVMGYGSSMPNYKCYPFFSQSGGEVVIANDTFIGESASANPSYTLTGGKLTCNGVSSGFALNAWNSDGLNATLTISGSGTEAYFAKLAVRKNAVLSVTNGATIGVRSTETANPGTVIFDNATLTTYAPLNQPSEWFHNAGKLSIGAGGLTVNVPTDQYAYLGTVPVTNSALPGSKIVKTGAGTFALYNAEMPIDVAAGRLKLMGGHLTTNKIAKAITLAANAELELAVPHAAEADTLSLAGPNRFELTVPSLVDRAELWQVNSAATRRSDGILQLAYPAASRVGSAFMTRQVSVTNAWQASFSVAAAGARTLGSQGDGVCFVLQNDARGSGAYSTNVTGFGYAGTAYPVTNSFAVALDLTNRRLRFGTNGVFVSQVYDLSFLPGLGADSDKTYFSVGYDGSGLLSCTLTRKNQQTPVYTYAVNLQSLIGNTMAYPGFTAGNSSSRYEQHWVDDVSFTVSGAAKSFGQYGGKLSLAAGQNLGVTLNPAPTQNGFGLGDLTYADGSVIDVRQSVTPSVPVAALTDQGMWKLNACAHWKSDSRLALTTNATWNSGTAFLTNLYPVAGSWTAQFGYDIGLTSATPADYLVFMVQRDSSGNTSHTPTPGISIMWRYYEGANHMTQVKMYTNGVVQVASTNISPVNLVSGGHAVMTVSYDSAAKTITVITTQAAGSFTNVFSGVDMTTIVGATAAYLGFGAATGGSFAENLIGDFAFGAAAGAVGSWQRGYLAFGTASGSGTLIKKGNGALGIQDGPDNPFTNATVRLDAGGLVLRKRVCEPVTLGDDFYLSPVALWAPGGALQVMPCYSTQKGNAVTAKRHTVTQPWTARFTFFVGARSTSPADGFSFFVHNDSRGASALGGAYSGAGYSGINTSVGLEWNFYEKDSMSNTVVLCVNGGWSGARRSNLPIKITTIQQETDMIVQHDPVAQTLAVTMVQGTNAFSTTFTGVDIRSLLGDDLGYIGFGGGSGGEYCEARVKDFRFELTAPTNPLPVTACLGTAILAAGSSNTISLATVVPGATFAIGSAQVGDGATFGLESVEANGGTLAVSQTALSGAAAFEVGAGTTLSLTNVTGGTALTKRGSGTLSLGGATATYSGATMLSAGTLLLSSPVLPTTTDLYVTNSPTLNLAFTGKQYVHTLTADGTAMPGGQYTAANASWITGPGVLVVTYPPVGTLLFMK
jgi:autotransporter-associated beta strand protein